MIQQQRQRRPFAIISSRTVYAARRKVTRFFATRPIPRLAIRSAVAEGSSSGNPRRIRRIPSLGPSLPRLTSRRNTQESRLHSTTITPTISSTTTQPLPNHLPTTPLSLLARDSSHLPRQGRTSSSLPHRSKTPCNHAQTRKRRASRSPPACLSAAKAAARCASRVRSCRT